ncbi:MAG: inositol monophosphatase [Bacteroidales bacterium]|nr:inositol monophosphatase [Bacteroidales bacterium]
MIELKGICTRAIKIVEDCGNYIRTESAKFSGESVEEKGKHNYVTHVDKASELMLVERLAALIPAAGFIAEEGTSNKKSDEYNWVIDPLDGTTNFIHGLPPYSISVGLIYKGMPVLGIVHEIFTKEMFYAWEDGGAWLNGQPIKTSTVSKLNDSLIATGFPYTDFSRLKPYINTFTYLMEHSHGVRRLGSAAVDLAYLACGRFEAFYEYGLKPYDVAAGVCILKEAGGRVADFSGGDNYLFGEEIVATNAPIFDEFINIVQATMNLATE